MNKIPEAIRWVREGRPAGLLIIVILGAGVGVGLWFTVQDSRGELEITADVLAADRPWRLEETRGAVVEGTVTDLHLDGIIEAAYRGNPAVTGPFGLIDLDGRSAIVASREALPIGTGRYHGTIKGLHSDSDQVLLETIRTRRGDPEVPPIFVDLDEKVTPADRWLRVLMTGLLIVGFAATTRVYLRAWRRRRLGPPPPLPPPGHPPPPTGPPAGPVPWNG